MSTDFLNKREPSEAGYSRELSGGKGDDGAAAERESEPASDELCELRVRCPCVHGPVQREQGCARCGVGGREHEQDERVAEGDGSSPEKILRLSADPIVSS